MHYMDPEFQPPRNTALRGKTPRKEHRRILSKNPGVEGSGAWGAGTFGVWETVLVGLSRCPEEP